MKRFTETLKWSDPWFRKLTPELKLIWQWILDNCDSAGVIEPDLELASFQIGYQYPSDTLLLLGDRVSSISQGKWHVVKFVKFQYGELSRDCKAHNPVFLSIKKHGIDGYLMGMDTLKETDTDKEKEKGKEKIKGDAEWIKTLKSNPAYAGIDVDREFSKMTAWCSVNGKEATRRRFVNWLNRAEKPLNGVPAKALIKLPTEIDVCRYGVQMGATVQFSKDWHLAMTRKNWRVNGKIIDWQIEFSSAFAAQRA